MQDLSWIGVLAQHRFLSATQQTPGKGQRHIVILLAAGLYQCITCSKFPEWSCQIDKIDSHLKGYRKTSVITKALRTHVQPLFASYMLMLDFGGGALHDYMITRGTPAHWALCLQAPPKQKHCCIVELFQNEQGGYKVFSVGQANIWLRGIVSHLRKSSLTWRCPSWHHKEKISTTDVF